MYLYPSINKQMLILCVVLIFPKIVFSANYNTDSSGNGTPATNVTVPLTHAASDTLTVQKGSNLVSTAAAAPAVSVEGGTTVTVHAGAVLQSSAANQAAIENVNNVGALAITIINSGTIELGVGGGAATDVIDLGIFDQAVTTVVTNNAGAIINGTVNGSKSNFQLNNAGTIEGDVTGSEGDDTFNLTGGNITGAIEAGGNTNSITLNLNGGTVSGDIELSDPVGNGSGTLNVGNVNPTNYSTVSNISGVQNVTISNGSQFTLSNGNTLTLIADPGGGANGNFTVDTGGIAILSGTIAGGQNITNNGNMTLNTNNITANITNNGTFTTTGTRTLQGAYTCPAGGTHNVRINIGAGTAEKLITSGGNNLNLNNGAVSITQTDGANFTSTPTVIPIATAGGVASVNNTTVPTSATITYALAINGQNIELTATRTSGFGDLLDSSELDSHVGDSLNAFVNSQNSDARAVVAALDSLSSSEISDAMKKLAPSVNDFFIASRHVQDLSIRVIENHVSHLITVAAFDNDENNAETGMAAGDGYSNDDHRNPNFSIWVKPFGNALNQRARGQDDGFNSSTGGVEVGMDTQVLPNVWLGGALSYAHARVKTKATARNLTDINSYQGTLYLTYSPEYYFIDGFVSFARNRYRNTREIQFGTVNRSAKGVFYGNQPAIKARAGYKHRWGNVLFVPMASLQYTYLHQTKYKEKGASSINLKDVNQKSTNALIGGIGMRVSYLIDNKTCYQLIPQVHAMYTHDFLAEKQVATAALEGGGPTFESSGTRPARGALHTGVGLTWKGEAWQLSATYDFEKKSKLEGHTVIAQLKYLW